MEGEGERRRRGACWRSGQTLAAEGEAFGSAKTGSEQRAERVRNQRIWPFKSPIYGAFGGEFGDIRVFFSLLFLIFFFFFFPLSLPSPTTTTTTDTPIRVS